MEVLRKVTCVRYVPSHFGSTLARLAVIAQMVTVIEGDSAK